MRRTHPLPAFHLRSLQSFRDAIKKSRTILNITGAIVSYWKHGGINLEKLGADDLMPAFMYSLVKANVPNLYSELQFLNEFVVEKNFSSDQFNHYLMTRKRMSDLEAALHFINSIDMNVRDEKNALVPVTTMVDRVLNILQVGVAEYLERKVVLVPVHVPFVRTFVVSFARASRSLSFLCIVTGTPHLVDIRTFPQNRQPWPEIVWARPSAAAGPRPQPVSDGLKQIDYVSLSVVEVTLFCHRCSNAHTCLKFAVPLFNRSFNHNLLLILFHSSFIQPLAHRIAYLTSPSQRRHRFEGRSPARHAVPHPLAPTWPRQHVPGLRALVSIGVSSSCVSFGCSYCVI